MRATFSPDGKYLAVRTHNGIKILNAATGDESRRLGRGRPYSRLQPGRPAARRRVGGPSCLGGRNRCRIGQLSQPFQHVVVPGL